HGARASYVAYLPWIWEGGPLAAGTSYFTLTMLWFVLGFWFAIVKNRFGSLIVTVSLIVLALALLAGAAWLSFNRAWPEVWMWLADAKAIGLAFWALGLSVVCAAGSYLTLRHLTSSLRAADQPGPAARSGDSARPPSSVQQRQRCPGEHGGHRHRSAHGRGRPPPHCPADHDHRRDAQRRQSHEEGTGDSGAGAQRQQGEDDRNLTAGGDDQEGAHDRHDEDRSDSQLRLEPVDSRQPRAEEPDHEDE